MAGTEPENCFRLDDRLALSIPEGARVLGVSEGHVRNLMPELPHVRLGGRVVIPVDLLRDWLRERAQSEAGKVDQAVEEVMASFENDLQPSD